jgi:nitroreductase
MLEFKPSRNGSVYMSDKGRSSGGKHTDAYIFGEPITEIIKRRRSVRTYSKESIPEAKKEKLKDYFKQVKGPFEAGVRFELLDKLEIKADSNIKLGTYGMIQGASSFIAAAVEKKEHNMEQLGYAFEKLVLFATSLGLGTCWLAGTFNKSEFSRALKVGTDEVLPIVTPLGYASRWRSPVDMLIKPVPERKIRKSWDRLFFKDSFYTALEEAEAGDYEIPLEMLRLAPSASNKQPWRVVKAGDAFLFYLAHDALYSSRYPYDIQKIDMGIAMAHFELAITELGLKGSWTTRLPDALQIKGTPKEYEHIVTWVAE